MTKGGYSQNMYTASVFGAATNVGIVRKNNEDSYSFLRSKDKRFVLLIIADGMGGHSYGEVASQIAVQYSTYVIDNSFREDMTDQEILEMLGNAVEAANIQVELETKLKPEMSGMGTTLTIGLIINYKFYIAHVGDSRIYLLRNDKFYQLTKDDTYVQTLVDSGELDADLADSHPQHNLLTKAIGSPEQICPELIQYTLNSSDKILFCTDGLYDALSNYEIKNILSKETDPDICANKLVNKTLENGAPDNVTVIVGFI